MQFLQNKQAFWCVTFWPPADCYLTHRDWALISFWGRELLTWAGWPVPSWAPWRSSSCLWSWCWCEGWWPTAGWSSRWAAQPACWCFPRGRAVQWSCTIYHWGCLWTLKKSDAGSVYPGWLPEVAWMVADHQRRVGREQFSLRTSLFFPKYSFLRRTKIRTIIFSFSGKRILSSV